MAKLTVDQNESQLLDETISRWERDGLLDAKKAEELKASYQIKGFDWKRLAQYSFWIAMACGIIAIASLVINETIISWIEKLYNTPDIVISLISAALAVLFYYSGNKRKKLYPERTYSNEALLCFGVLFTASAIAFLGKAIDNGSGHFSILFLLSVFIYAWLAIIYESKLIWAFTLVSLGSWFGTETGYQANWSNYFLGMNYPMRFVLFGVGLTLVSFILRKKNKLRQFAELTYVMGYLYLFISLWLLSIFGNFGSITDWLQIKQINLFFYGLLAAIISAGVLIWGLKNKDIIAREFGITFLLINLYSRYFEYFWDNTDKTIFFIVLAVSFWLIGRKAEKIWNIKPSDK